MTKDQAKEVLEMLSKDKPLEKDVIFKIIDMIDEGGVQYIPTYIPSSPSIPQDPIYPTVTHSFKQETMNG